MHRDIKPENIITRYQGDIINLCIIDFGLATYVKDKFQLYKRCGTPGFVAPEILRLNDGDWYNEKCDIFSLGIIFYIILTGEQPFKQINKNKMMRENAAANIDYDSEQLENTSKSCMNLLRQML